MNSNGKNLFSLFALINGTRRLIFPEAETRMMNTTSKIIFTLGNCIFLHKTDVLIKKGKKKRNI